MKRFLDLMDFTDAEIDHLVHLARELERNPRSEVARSRVLGLMFMNPSMRTLASMQAAMAQLGGASFVITPGSGSWQIETRPGVVMDGDAAEHIHEAIPVLAEYCDILGVRCFAKGKNLTEDLADPVIRAIAEICPKPFINLESGMTHPCQSLADWKTLDDLGIPRSGGRFVLSWVYHPRALALAVPTSTLMMAARRGMDVTVLRPDGFDLPAPVMAEARTVATRAGGRVIETSDRRAALDGAHVLYAKSWGAPDFYGRPEEETHLRRPHIDWCVQESWFGPARPDARFMHCLPVRRNVKVADHVLDGPRSVVIRQAGNRLHAQKAVLHSMLTAGK